MEMKEVQTGTHRDTCHSQKNVQGKDALMLKPMASQEGGIKGKLMTSKLSSTEERGTQGDAQL